MTEITIYPMKNTPTAVLKSANRRRSPTPTMSWSRTMTAT